ncbi:hypothetical protein SG34_027215 [Thalassomonas viridans]|uniref:Uncharacterized protein n=1 Tax=Thalassomonas viridans TaxID=137584 RepID=A0AAE9Z1P7_9GAMM|nr:hypothetical protein [Thalassomonas viridans]WDE04953.1 hypothetical protein SG34_027215 [Thalassomonas viridans]
MMANIYDMPELHSVKVFVTENTPPRRRYGFANPSNTGITSPHGFLGCFTASCFIAGCFISKNMPLTFAGGQAHV